jgi:UDP-N-acetylglucosamine 2-epimerase (non-hydrolysing)
MRICCVVGTRPNFIKIAPILRAFEREKERLASRFGTFVSRLVHTGQHYDDRMSDIFFKQLGIREPDINLGVNTHSNLSAVAQTMLAFESELAVHPADLVLVVGDVSATSACAQTAAYAGIPVAHVEAGLRSFDRSMPEELNRIVTDHLSSIHFASCEDGVKNLLNEGIGRESIRLVGNVMIDTLVRNMSRFDEVKRRMGFPKGEYGVATLHRPSNVDAPRNLESILKTLARTSNKLPIILPVHPRTKERIESAGLRNMVRNLESSQLDKIKTTNAIWMIEPLGYLEFQALLSSAKLVVTDSGGLQEETTYLRIPCITIRKNTERPITITQGSNQLAGTDPDRIETAIDNVLTGRFKAKNPPVLWDGHAADRIVKEILTLSDY